LVRLSNRASPIGRSMLVSPIYPAEASNPPGCLHRLRARAECQCSGRGPAHTPVGSARLARVPRGPGRVPPGEAPPAEDEVPPVGAENRAADAVRLDRVPRTRDLTIALGADGDEPEAPHAAQAKPQPPGCLLGGHHAVAPVSLIRMDRAGTQQVSLRPAHSLEYEQWTTVGRACSIADQDDLLAAGASTAPAWYPAATPVVPFADPRRRTGCTAKLGP
jgi:hypothetical protein